MSLERVKELTILLMSRCGHHEPEVGEFNRLYASLAPAERDFADHYSLCIEEGCSPKLADMLASQSPPMSNTDREFLEGHCCGNQFEKQPQIGDRLKAIAESHGQDVTGKVYLGQLASFPGDPAAWVSGRGDVQRVIESRGWAVEGSVDVKHREAPPRLPQRKAKPGSLAARLHAAGLPIASS